MKKKAGSKKPKRGKSFRAEVWQDKVMVACVEGGNKERVNKEIIHYACRYAEDGPVTINLA